MEEFQLYLIELAEIFGYNYDEFFFDYLKSISIPNTTKCGKEIKKGEGGWKCLDCEILNCSIYCKDCFIKEKHKGHKIYFNPKCEGFCDCGEKLILKQEGFCNKHKGDFNNMKDLMDFIKLSIPENLLSIINDILNNIFLLFIEKIKNISEENEDNEDEIYNMIDALEIFCDKLYNNNLGLFYFVTLKFTENFPYETNHKCFFYDENKNLISIIKKDMNKKHYCICPFLQVIIYILMKRKTKQNSSSFFNLFLQTYKNQIVTSLCFFNTFSELFYNDNLDYLRIMAFQLANENISKLLFKKENIIFIQSMFEDIFHTCEFLFNEESYNKLNSIFYRFYEIVSYLPTKTTIDKINSNYKLMKIIIDICCLSNNRNVFENKLKFESFQYNGLNMELLNVENYCLLTIISLIHILDFDNQEEIGFIFNIIFEKLFEIKKYNESLENKKFTPHIFTIKCYSIFLNRYCFNYSIKNESDLLDSFSHFQNLFPKSKELNIFLFEELIKFYGFMISNKYSFFSYFGEDMIEYYGAYFNNKYIYIKADFSLMKYLLTLPEIKEVFNLQKIISLSDIDSSNSIYKYLNEENLDIKEMNFLEQEENNLKYINSIIEFLYFIIKDNIFMENIAFRNIEFKWKIKDEIYEKLYQKEKEKIHLLIKNDIIHFILGNKNLVKRQECVDYLEKIFSQDYLDIVDEILNKDCDKISLTSGLIEFSLKKQIVNECDIDNIINFINKKNAIEYITEFQLNNSNLKNINILEPLLIKKNLMKNIYENFYNEKNLDELIKAYNFIYVYKEKFPLLNNIFYLNLTKILSFAYKLCSSQLLDENYKLKILDKIKRIKDKEFLKNLGENKEEKENNLINNKKSGKNLKEKFKKLFAKKNDLIKDQIIHSNIIIEEKDQKEEEECVYCRQSFHKEQNNNFEFYGKICYYFSDYLTDIMRKKSEGQRNKGRKFVSCNHKIHFKCYNEFICKNISFESNEFECPLCKKLSNIIICDFSSFNNNNNYFDLIKGINYGNKINFDEYIKDNIDIKYQSLVDSNILSFENYCSKICHKQILIKDINSDIKLEGKILKSIIEDFEECTIYYTLTNNKQEQIEIWKNILYNLRFLYQYKILKFSDNFIQLINILKIHNINNFGEFLSLYSISDIINKFIIICIILFNPTKENKEKIKNIFHYIILPYLIYISFNKSSNETFDKYINNKKTELIKVIELYKLKCKICLLLLNEKEENINLNISLEQITSYIKSNSFFTYLYQFQNNNFIRLDEYLEIPELHLSKLPEKAFELLNMQNNYCLYCHKKDLTLTTYICLLCGNQMCNNKYCIVEDKLKGKKEYSLIYHSKKCCGGNGLFLNVTNAEIIFIFKRRLIESGIFIYLNNFGEPMKDTYLNDEYKLNNTELQKGISKYIDLSYRKKIDKIYYSNNND